MEDRVIIEASNRCMICEEYYFSKKLKEVALMRKSGIDVINLGIGNPDLPPSQEVLDELHKQSLIPTNNGYQSYSGMLQLRQAFCEWYQTYFNVKLDPESEILPLMGSKEGIMHISMAFTNPGDKILIPNPGYPAYSSVAKICGAEPLLYSLKESHGWYPNIDAIEDSDLSGVKMMWINYPNMPTGVKASRALFERLVKFAYDNSILLCNDNPYSFILNREHISLLSVDGAKSVAVELNSISKSHNMAGWRVGMVASDSQKISWILRVKSNMDSGMYAPLQLAAVKALKSHNGWYDSLDTLYRERREAAESLFESLGCVYDKSQSGLFLWGKIPKDYENSYQYCDRLLYKYGVFVTPGALFGSEGESFIRISLCSPVEVIAEAKGRVINNLKIENEKSFDSWIGSDRGLSCSIPA